MSTHDCPGGCGRQVPRHLLACRGCWFRLPKDIQSAVYEGYRNDPVRHRQAMRRAADWYRDNPRPNGAQQP